MNSARDARWATDPMPPPMQPSVNTAPIAVERQVPAAMERLAVTIEMCRQSIQRLGERLSPVLVPSKLDTQKGEIARRTACPVAEALFGMAEDVEQLSRLTDLLRDELQV